ncbi:hypothetical protein KIN20_014392 [Parelaphostrongylus tenuis]|uniref:Uncharacterized protein n=1 Tax=Parelaphostrongylus tenuis TaxID=148309 RepID=A0AAD5N376_PARTN|nr:hypothetical protein KIN20_014392 [Parelaphostrongylus tenuis]
MTRGEIEMAYYYYDHETLRNTFHKDHRKPTLRKEMQQNLAKTAHSIGVLFKSKVNDNRSVDMWELAARCRCRNAKDGQEVQASNTGAEATDVGCNRRHHPVILGEIPLVQLISCANEFRRNELKKYML